MFEKQEHQTKYDINIYAGQNGLQKIVARHALVVTSNMIIERYVRKVLSNKLDSVCFSVTGFEAIKNINSSIPYRILIADLIIDEISGMAICMALKKRRAAWAIGFNNGRKACKPVAVEYGFDEVFDSETTLSDVDHFFKYHLL